MAETKSPKRSVPSFLMYRSTRTESTSVFSWNPEKTNNHLSLLFLVGFNVDLLLVYGLLYIHYLDSNARLSFIIIYQVFHETVVGQTMPLCWKGISGKCNNFIYRITLFTNIYTGDHIYIRVLEVLCYCLTV